MERHLSIEEKVGQLMMFGFAGKSVPSHIREFILRHNLGGIIHFSRNITSPGQIQALNQELQGIASQSPGALHLLIATDQEGGSVVRLTNGVNVSPGNMALGAAASLELAEQAGAVMGEELRRAGFNVNLAPCLDVNNNSQNPVIGVRSFGSDARQVAGLGAANIRGLQKHVAAVAKHFPGHGDTHVDSHLSLPVIDHSWERLNNVELWPFKKAIAQGVEGILAAHVFFPALEKNPNLPATLSPAVLTRLLREQLGFAGLIFTDCMEMEAISRNFSMRQAAVLTVAAGSDIVLVSHTPARQIEAYWAVVEAVKTGEISVERLDQSLARIVGLKKRLAQTAPGGPGGGSKANREVMEKIVQKSLTVVRGQENLPLGAQAVLVIETAAQAASIAEERISSHTTFGQALQTAGFTVKEAEVGLDCSAKERQRVLEMVRGQPLVIIVSQDAHRYPGQAALIKEVARRAEKLVVIGARTPYELSVLENVATYIAVYSNRAFVWKQVVDLLMGKRQALGRLPVSLSLGAPGGDGGPNTDGI